MAPRVCPDADGSGQECSPLLETLSTEAARIKFQAGNRPYKTVLVLGTSQVKTGQGWGSKEEKDAHPDQPHSAEFGTKVCLEGQWRRKGTGVYIAARLLLQCALGWAGASWAPAVPSGQFSQASWACFIRGELGAGSEILRK